MKKAFLYSPLAAALVFAVPEAWQQISEPGPGYIPVVNEALLFLFGYLVAMVFNGIIVVPLGLLVRWRWANLFAGGLFGFFLALIVTTLAYAFEIFEYQSSIFHPAYLYPVFMPVLVLAWLSYFFLIQKPADSAEKTADASPPSDEDAAA